MVKKGGWGRLTSCMDHEGGAGLDGLWRTLSLVVAGQLSYDVRIYQYFMTVLVNYRQGEGSESPSESSKVRFRNG